MARFYFHVRGQHTIDDADGAELPGLRDAIALAKRMARDLSHDKEMSGNEVRVTDEAGREVYRAPVWA
jgi:hypothetical protein